VRETAADQTPGRGDFLLLSPFLPVGTDEFGGTDEHPHRQADILDLIARREIRDLRGEVPFRNPVPGFRHLLQRR
jgi:hypothetical protein